MMMIRGKRENRFLLRRGVKEKERVTWLPRDCMNNTMNNTVVDCNMTKFRGVIELIRK